MKSNNRNRDEGDSFSIVEVLFYPYDVVREWFADALSGDDRIRDHDGGAMSSVVSVLTLPFRLLFAFLVFMVQAWTTSRRGRAFILGIPAVATVVLCSTLFWVTTFYFNKLHFIADPWLLQKICDRRNLQILKLCCCFLKN